MRKSLLFFMIMCISLTIYAEDKGKNVLKDGRTWYYITFYSSGDRNDTIYSSYTLEGPIGFDGKTCYRFSGGGDTMFYEQDNCVYSYSSDYLTGEKTWHKELDFNMTLGMDDVLSVDTILVGNQLCRRINLGYDIWVEGIGGRMCGIIANWRVPVPGSYRGSRVLSVYDGDECIFREEDFRKPAYTTEIKRMRSEYTDSLTNVVYTYNPNDIYAEVKAAVRNVIAKPGEESEVVTKPGSPDVIGDIAILDKFIIDGKNYTVNQIGEGAFIYCKNLTSITLPETLVSIGDVAFYDCTNLVRIEIPKTVTSIGRDIIGTQCTKLTSVVSHIEEPFDAEDAFRYLDTSNITLYVPEGCGIKYKAFKGWRNFENIVETEATGTLFPKDLEKTNMKDYIFDLQGRHLISVPAKGVYIQNSKKRIAY